MGYSKALNDSFKNLKSVFFRKSNKIDGGLQLKMVAYTEEGILTDTLEPDEVNDLTLDELDAYFPDWERIDTYFIEGKDEDKKKTLVREMEEAKPFFQTQNNPPQNSNQLDINQIISSIQANQKELLKEIKSVYEQNKPEPKDHILEAITLLKDAILDKNNNGSKIELELEKIKLQLEMKQQEIDHRFRLYELAEIEKEKIDKQIEKKKNELNEINYKSELARMKRNKESDKTPEELEIEKEALRGFTELTKTGIDKVIEYFSTPSENGQKLITTNGIETI
ncbi:MAG: hypothetical protein KDH96_01735 [Candidatus Riesia sp.]|nr:hypothetical protein [Candidatus Riesia sp.]